MIPVTSLPESSPHTQLFIPFFSKDNFLTVLTYRAASKIVFKTRLFRRQQLSFCTENPQIQWDSVKGTFLWLQLPHHDHISRFTRPCEYHSCLLPLTKGSQSFSGSSAALALSLHTGQILNLSKCISFMYYKASL